MRQTTAMFHCSVESLRATFIPRNLLPRKFSKHGVKFLEHSRERIWLSEAYSVDDGQKVPGSQADGVGRRQYLNAAAVVKLNMKSGVG